jgi:translation initiation factor 1 (eIF-1/SUI1)
MFINIFYIQEVTVGGDDPSATSVAALDAEKAPKKKPGSKKEKESKVVIAKIQRQKRKYVTAIAGLETVPGFVLLKVLFSYF